MHLSHFIYIDTMDNNVRCLVILHSIRVEEQLEKDGQIYDDEDSKTVKIVCKKKFPMRGGLVRFFTPGTTSLLGSVAGFHDMKIYIEY